MNIFHTNCLPNGLQQETLARLVRTLLLRLVDDNLGKQPEGEALLKVSNKQRTGLALFACMHHGEGTGPDAAIRLGRVDRVC